MAAVVESSTNTGITTVSSGSPNLVITKPTGLAVGDELIAFVCGFHTGAVSISYATPSGWSLQEDTGNTSSTWRMYTFYKVADSSDVAASNFTFVATTAGTNPAAGSLHRISGFGIIDDSNKSNGAASITNALSGLTRANELHLFATAISGGTSVSSQAYATDNPTWTEIFDVTDSVDKAFAVAQATRTATTDSGNATYSGGTGGRATTVLAIAPRIDSSKTSDIPNLVSRAQNLFPRLVITSELNASGSVMNTPEWTNPDKPTEPTWINTDK